MAADDLGMTPERLFLPTAGVAAVLLGVGVLVWLVTVAAETRAEQVAEAERAVLLAPPPRVVAVGRAPVGAARRQPCLVCRGRHCPGCAEPARVMSLRTTPYVPRHGVAELPARYRFIASVMSLDGRTDWLVRQRTPRGWRPPSPTRAHFEAWARRRLRNAGYPPLIGTFQLSGRLP